MIIISLIVILLQAQVEGTVLRAATNAPVAGARILLTKAGGRLSDSITATAGEDGKFSIGNIPAGTYRVFSDHEDYVRAEFGQSRFGRPGAPVTLAAGQQMKDAVLVMTPSGVISGRVLDQYNEPMSRIYVRALKAGYSQGARVMNPVMETQTNDLGEYRLYGLPPGTYFVSAAPYVPSRLQGDTYVTPTPPRLDAPGEGAGMQALAGMLAAGAFVDPLVLSGETYVPTYYPGTIDPASAKPLELPPAAMVSGIDLRTTRVRGARVKGEIVDGNGQPVSAMTVTFGQRPQRRGGPSLTLRNVTSLDFSGLAPGAYLIRGDAPNLAGSLWIDVGPESIDNIGNVRLVLNPRFNVSGRITIEGRPVGGNNPDFAGMRVQLESQQSISRANVQPNGEFMAANLEAGDYRLSLAGLPENAYLKGPGGTVHLTSTPPRPLELIVSPNGGKLDTVGTPGSVVVLVPDPARRTEYRLYRTAIADAAGRAHIEGIVPGEYKVFAWDDIDDDAWQDPEVLRLYEDRGEKVKIDEGSVRELRISVIR